jgi:hypothetical protein
MVASGSGSGDLFGHHRSRWLRLGRDLLRHDRRVGLRLGGGFSLLPHFRGIAARLDKGGNIAGFGPHEGQQDPSVHLAGRVRQVGTQGMAARRDVLAAGKRPLPGAIGRGLAYQPAVDVDEDRPSRSGATGKYDVALIVVIHGLQGQRNIERLRHLLDLALRLHPGLGRNGGVLLRLLFGGRRLGLPKCRCIGLDLRFRQRSQRHVLLCGVARRCFCSFDRRGLFLEHRLGRRNHLFLRLRFGRLRRLAEHRKGFPGPLRHGKRDHLAGPRAETRHIARLDHQLMAAGRQRIVRHDQPFPRLVGRRRRDHLAIEQQLDRGMRRGAADGDERAVVFEPHHVEARIYRHVRFRLRHRGFVGSGRFGLLLIDGRQALGLRSHLCHRCLGHLLDRLAPDNLGRGLDLFFGLWRRLFQYDFSLVPGQGLVGRNHFDSLCLWRRSFRLRLRWRRGVFIDDFGSPRSLQRSRPVLPPLVRGGGHHANRRDCGADEKHQGVLHVLSKSMAASFMPPTGISAI